MMATASRSRTIGGERTAPSLLATMKVRVSRLEAALRDKEAEITRLQATTKTTKVNELKIQAHTYYQEVVRLRNLLNISQHATVPILHKTNINSVQQHQSTDERLPSVDSSSTLSDSHQVPPKLLNRRPHTENGRLTMDENSEPVNSTKTIDEENDFKDSLTLLHKENNDLREQVSTLVNTLQNTEANYSDGSQSLMEKVLEKLSETRVDSTSSFMQQRLTELRSKEMEWERERSSLKELINTLQEDRAFYKETVNKKEEDVSAMVNVRAVVMHRHLALVRGEMEALQKEVMTLQREMELVKELEMKKLKSSTRSSLKSGSSSDSAPSQSRPPLRQSRLRAPSTTTQNRGALPKEKSVIPKERGVLPKLDGKRGAEGIKTAGAKQMATSKRLASVNRAQCAADAKSCRVANGAVKRNASVAPSRQSASATTSTSSSRSSSSKQTPVSSPLRSRPLNGIKATTGASVTRNTVTSSSSSSRQSSSHPSPSKQVSLPPKGRAQPSSRSSTSSSAQSTPRQTRTVITESDTNVLVELLKPEPHNVEAQDGVQTHEGGTQTLEDSTQTHEDSTQTHEDVTQTHEDVTQTREDSTPEDGGETSDLSPSSRALRSLHWDSPLRCSETDSWATEREEDEAGSEEKSERRVVSKPPSPSVRKVSDRTITKTVRTVSDRTNTKTVAAKSARNQNNVVDSVDDLKNLLSSHVSRQKKLNSLLSRQPVIVPNVPTTALTPQPRTSRSLKHRRSPEGAEDCDGVSESSITSSPVKTPSRRLPVVTPRKAGPSVTTSQNKPDASPTLVRQGTFNLDESEAFIDKSIMGESGEGSVLGPGGWDVEEDAKRALTDTLSAHLARVRKLSQSK